jgi:probable F420-dependent oxidoreductase
MRFAINVPNFGEYGNPRLLASLAREAELAGWDGFFVWDHLQFFDPLAPVPVADPWIALAAVATATERIRLGPMVTPLARRHPWQVAREAATLDHLSNGRLILGVGLGGLPEAEFDAFGEVSDARVRAQKLDEGLAILAGLWTGEPFSFAGEHYRVAETRFQPNPVQSPRIPIWVGGSWPNKAPMRRAARWDGAFPASSENSGMAMLSPDEVRDIATYVAAHRQDDGPFDLVIGGETPGDDPSQAASVIAPYADAGVTWWQEMVHGFRGPLAAMRARIQQGPPPVAISAGNTRARSK